MSLENLGRPGGTNQPERKTIVGEYGGNVKTGPVELTFPGRDDLRDLKVIGHDRAVVAARAARLLEERLHYRVQAIPQDDTVQVIPLEDTITGALETDAVSTVETVTINEDPNLGGATGGATG
jgi:hypothetical protein